MSALVFLPFADAKALHSGTCWWENQTREQAVEVGLVFV